MKKQLSMILAGCMAVALAGSLAACSSSSSSDTTTAAEGETTTAASSSADTSDINIGLVVKTATNAHFQDIAYGAAIAANELGVSLTTQNTTTESDVEGQITLCENLISSGADALILTANDSDGVAAAVDAAHDANVPFVTVDTEITNVWGDNVKEYMPDYIGVVHEEMAQNMAEIAINEAKDRFGEDNVNVIILEGVQAATSSQQRTAGFDAAIESSGVNLLISQSANFDQDTAQTTMGDFLQQPDYQKVNVVLCCNDLMAVGAMNALEENGYTVGGDDGIIVCGIDGNVLSLESINEGKIYGTAYDWSILQGYYAVYDAYNLITGAEAVPSETWTGYTAITSENIADYLEHGQELAKWTMGDPVTEVSDYMQNFLKMGEELTTFVD